MPWDTLNLGGHVGDGASAVAANRQTLQAMLQQLHAPVRPVYLRQVHGIQVVTLDESSMDEMAFDAASSCTPGIACTVLVADCLPVLLTNRRGTRVAAAHAGWRGLAAGVLEETLDCFHAEGGQGDGNDDDILAWLGPCIGPQTFEVGAEVLEAFCARDADAVRFFVPRGASGKYLANLPALARQRLAAAGVRQVYGNDGTGPWCTVSNPLRFFSHRRDAALLGSSGRMAACVWLGG